MKDYAYGIVPIFKTKYENLYLILRSVHGHWTFPKGHKEGAETAEETARRELCEETGISEIVIPDTIQFSEEYSFEAPTHTVHKLNTFFIGYVTDTTVTIQKEEILEYRWATYKEACELAWPELKKTIDEVQNYLNKTNV